MIINVRDVNYYVEVHGKGHPVLLLHGFTGASENWHPFFADWSTQFQLICVDIIGHGKTDSPSKEERYRMQEVVKDLKVILDSLKVQAVSLIGYSMGGRLALSFATTYPDRVSSLILESSSPGLSAASEREARLEQDKNLANKILKEGVSNFVSYWEDITLFASQKRLSTETKDSIRSQRLRNNPIGLANSLLGMGTGAQPSWWDELKALYFPVLLLCGDVDQKFCNIAEKMDKLLPNSKKIVVENSGHAIHVEQPKFFGKIVKEYLIERTLKK